jgi:hypothetical protein
MAYEHKESEDYSEELLERARVEIESGYETGDEEERRRNEVLSPSLLRCIGFLRRQQNEMRERAAREARFGGGGWVVAVTQDDLEIPHIRALRGRRRPTGSRKRSSESFIVTQTNVAQRNLRRRQNDNFAVDEDSALSETLSTFLRGDRQIRQYFYSFASYMQQNHPNYATIVGNELIDLEIVQGRAENGQYQTLILYL